VLVGTASSREVAVDLIANTSPQVIVVDIDGDYGPDTIADFAERSDVPLLALTGSRDTEVHDGAVLSGACGGVQKREAADILVDAIRCVHEGEMWINQRENAVARFPSGSISHGDGYPPGNRGEDPIVVPLGAAYPDAVPTFRWRQRRRIH